MLFVHLNNFVLVSLVLCHVLLNFDYFSEYRHTSIQQAAVYLTQNLRPGETVCTPQLNGYSEKIQQTIESYQNISVIKDLPTSQFFSCRKHFNNREPLPFSRVWIVSFDRLWEPSEKCDGWVGSFDCDENYYKDQLNGYARGNVIELKKPKHRDIFILLYEKF